MLTRAALAKLCSWIQALQLSTVGKEDGEDCQASRHWGRVEGAVTRKQKAGSSQIWLLPEKTYVTSYSPPPEGPTASLVNCEGWCEDQSIVGFNVSPSFGFEHSGGEQEHKLKENLISQAKNKLSNY